MLRKAIYCFLALLVCAVIVVGIDVARHYLAIERLQQKHVHLAQWRYRVGGDEYKAPIGELILYGNSEEDLPRERRAWRRHLVASPDLMILTGKPIDERTVRDLAILRMSELCLQSCTGLTTAMMTELSGISSIRTLEVGRCDATSDGLNLLWSRLPDLEFVDVTNVGLLDDTAFRDIKKAQKLNRLDLRGQWKSIDQVLAQVSEAPAVEKLVIEYGGTMEASAERLASMPALKQVNWVYAQPPAAFLARLKSLQPRLKLTLNQDKEL